MSEPPTLPKKRSFGQAPDGEPCEVYRLSSANGAYIEVCDYGVTITSIVVPDRDGQLDDVSLGHTSVEGYAASPHYMGCVVGRYANRIANGRFVLDGTPYELLCNSGPHHLHGGRRGFHAYRWRVREVEAGAITFQRTSPHGEEGYPGEVQVTCRVGWDDQCQLSLDYKAMSDRPTILNLTNHSYFNLAGQGAGSALGQVLQILADHYAPTDATQIPLDAVCRVDDSPFDFRTPKAIGVDIEADDEQLKIGNGYDHHFVVAGAGRFRLVATVFDPQTGRFLEVRTTKPGLQLYTANWLEDSGKAHYSPRSGFCLETQYTPDSPNRTETPTAVLRPGETYRSSTSYRFAVAPDAQ